MEQLRDKEMTNISPSADRSTMQDFGDCQNDVMPKESKRASSKDKEEMSQEQKLLKIDITFDDNQGNNKPEDAAFALQNIQEGNFINSALNQKTHQGLASSQLIKYYVEHYKCLKEVSIILKQFLARMDLNSPYHGKYRGFVG